MKELPKKWEWVKLDEIATVGAGNGAPQGDQYFEDGVYPFVRTHDVGREKKTLCLIKTKDKVNEHAVNEYKLKLWPEKTLLIPKSGASTFLNNRALLGIPSYVSSHLATIVADDNIHSKYLYYWSLTVDAKHLTHDISYPSLRLSEIESAKIPLPFKNGKPDLKKQQKIVAILEKAEQTMKLHEQAEGLIVELLKSVFYYMFGDPIRNPKEWELVRVDDHVDVLTGNAFKSSEYVNNKSEIKLCGGLIILPNKIDWSKANYWRSDKIKGIDKYLLKEKDVVIAMDRPWISSGFKIGMINKIDLPALLVQRTARLRGRDFNQHFLYFIFKHKSFEIHCKLTETTVPHISPKDIKKYKIPFPSIELQNEFSKIVEKAIVIQNNFELSKQESENIFNVLLQEVFTGELIS